MAREEFGGVVEGNVNAWLCCDRSRLGKFMVFMQVEEYS